MPLSPALTKPLQNNPTTQLWNYTHIATNTTTLIKTGPGTLHSIVVNTTAAGSIKVEDALTDTTPVIATLKASIAEGTYLYDVVFTTGLNIVTAGSSDITVSWI